MRDEVEADTCLASPADLVLEEGERETSLGLLLRLGREVWQHPAARALAWGRAPSAVLRGAGAPAKALQWKLPVFAGVAWTPADS